MAGQENLIPNNLRSKEEVRQNSRKGGIASGKRRAEKKTIQKILTALCDSKCEDIPQFAKIAAKLGIDGNKSVKELFTLVSTLNSLKQAKMDELGKMAELLGEQREMQSESESEQADMLEAIKKAVKNEN